MSDNPQSLFAHKRTLLDTRAQLDSLTAALRPLALKVKEVVGQIEAVNYQKQQTIKLSADEVSDRSMFVLLVFSALVVVFLIVIFAVILRAVLGPLSSFTAAMKGFSTGDGNLNDRMPYFTIKEMGYLAKYFNQFVEKLQHMFISVAKLSTTLDKTIQDVSAVSASTGGNVEEQYEQTTTTAMAMDEMAKSFAEVAQRSEMTKTLVMESSDRVLSGKETITGSTTAINTLADNLSQTLAVIEQNDENSNQIGSILGTINDITEQTNLLALNAAIEAARAGEYGRGFAVVADEVRALAKRTQDSTIEIQDMIGKLQHGTQQAVTTMKSSNVLMEQALASVSSAQNTFEEVAEQIHQIDELATSVAAANEQQTLTAKQVNESVQHISKVSEAIRDDANQLAQACDELSRGSSSLSHKLNDFNFDDGN